MLHYPESKDICVSYGMIKQIEEKKDYHFKHLCKARNNSFGSPILNMSNNKVIGIFIKNENNDCNTGLFIKYGIDEFIKKNYYNQILKEINKKFKLNIKEINMNILDLSKKNIGDKKLENLCRINFKELKELDLSYNYIFDIKVLEKVKFGQLEILDLSLNKISNIDILEKVNFKQLKKLNLFFNNISNIEVFGKVNFEILEELDLSFNEISNIEILVKANFRELKIINLLSNNI